MFGKSKEPRAVGYFFKIKLQTGLHYAGLLVSVKLLKTSLVKDSGMLQAVKYGDAVLKTTGKFGGLDIDVTFLNFKKKIDSEEPQFSRIKFDYENYVKEMVKSFEDRLGPPFSCEEIKSFGIFEINGKKEMYPFKPAKDESKSQK